MYVQSVQKVIGWLNIPPPTLFPVDKTIVHGRQLGSCHPRKGSIRQLPTSFVNRKTSLP